MWVETSCSGKIFIRGTDDGKTVTYQIIFSLADTNGGVFAKTFKTYGAALAYLKKFFAAELEEATNGKID